MVTAPGRNPIGAPPGSRRRSRTPDVGDLPAVSPNELRTPALRASPEDFGAGMAAETERAGRTVMALAAERIEEGRRADARVARAFAVNQVNLRSHEAALALENEMDPASAGFEPALRQRFDEIAREVVAETGQQHSLDGNTLKIIEQDVIGTQGTAFRAAQTRAHNVRVTRIGQITETQIDQLAINVRRGRIPLSDAIERAQEFVDAQRPMLPAAAEERLARDATRRIAFAETQRFIDADPRGALVALRAGKFDAYGLEPDDLLRLEAAAEREIEHRLTVGRAEAKRAENDLLVRVKRGGTLTPEVIDREANRIRALGAPEAADEFVAEMTLLADAQAEVAELIVLPEGEIARRLADRRQDPDSRSFDPDEGRRRQAVEDLLASQLKARREDPAGFFAPMVEEQIELLRRDADFDPAREAEARVGLSLELQRKAGVPVPQALSKAVAADFAARVQAAPATERAEVVRAIRDEFGAYGDMAINSLIAQDLDPMTRTLVRVADDPLVSQQLATVIEQGHDTLVKGVNAGDRQTMADVIAEELRDFIHAVRAGDLTGGREGAINQEVAAITDLALLYVRQGMDPAPAARQAARMMVTGRVDVMDTMYVPRQINGQEISMLKIEAMRVHMQHREQIEAFNPVPLGSLRELPAEIRRRGLVGTAVNSGFWVTNSQGTGAFLMVPVGNMALPLLNDLGQRYEFDFLETTNSHIRPLRVPDTGAFEMGIP